MSPPPPNLTNVELYAYNHNLNQQPASSIRISNKPPQETQHAVHMCTKHLYA